MNDRSPSALPRRYRLAWALLWFALLGALLRFGHTPAQPSAAAATLPRSLHAALRSPGGGEADPHATGGAIGVTAFRER